MERDYNKDVVLYHYIPDNSENKYIKLDYYSQYFMVIEQVSVGKKTHTYLIFTKDDRTAIGAIRWHGAWRKYCFFPEGTSVWDSTCLNDVIKFLSKVNKQYKEFKKNAGNVQI